MRPAAFINLVYRIEKEQIFHIGEPLEVGRFEELGKRKQWDVRGRRRHVRLNLSDKIFSCQSGKELVDGRRDLNLPIVILEFPNKIVGCSSGA